MRMLPLAALAGALCGCYVSAPLATPNPDTGTQLEIRLTEIGSDSLLRYLGPGVTEVDGKLLHSTSRDISVAVQVVSLQNGQEADWSGESVTVPRAAIASLRQRRFSRKRTLLLAGSVLAGGLAIIAGTTDAFGRSSHAAPTTKR